jgi:hypothetical protein
MDFLITAYKQNQMVSLGGQTTQAFWCHLGWFHLPAWLILAIP